MNTVIKSKYLTPIQDKIRPSLALERAYHTRISPQSPSSFSEREDRSRRRLTSQSSTTCNQAGHSTYPHKEPFHGPPTIPPPSQARHRTTQTQSPSTSPKLQSSCRRRTRSMPTARLRSGTSRRRPSRRAPCWPRWPARSRSKGRRNSKWWPWRKIGSEADEPGSPATSAPRTWRRASSSRGACSPCPASAPAPRRTQRCAARTRRGCAAATTSA